MDTVKYNIVLAEFSSAIRSLTLKRLDEVPKGFINWRLNNTAMSFADIVQHLIQVDKLFMELVQSDHKKFQWKFGSEEPHIKVSIGTYALMLEKLQKLQHERHHIIEELKKSQLNRQLTNEGGEDMTLHWFLLRKVLEHEIYHRGQIAAYLKVLKGESDRHSLQVN